MSTTPSMSPWEPLIATLDYDAIRLSDGRRFPLAPILPDRYRVGAILSACQRHDIAQLWVLPRAEATITAEKPDDWAVWRVLGRDHPSAERMWCEVARPGIYGRIALVRPRFEPKPHLWANARDGEELLEALCLLRAAVGVQEWGGWAWSAGSSAMALLRALHAGRGTLPLPVPPPTIPAVIADSPDHSWRRSIEPALLWLRQLTDVERRRRWLHGFDKNGMYLGACASLPLADAWCKGIPGPRQTWPRELTEAPGYWRVDGFWLRTLQPDGLPPLLSPAAQLPDGTAWVTTPTLRLLLDLGYPHSAILYAYVWAEHHQYLQPWYKALRDARNALTADARAGRLGAALALAAVKRLYTRGLGWLEMRSESWRRPDNPLARPDIAQAVRAAARANLIRDLLRLEPEPAGPQPFAAAIDAIYVASDEVDPLAAAPAGLRLGDGLGQWKPIPGLPVPLDDTLPVIGRGSAAGLLRWLASTR